MVVSSLELKKMNQFSNKGSNPSIRNWKNPPEFIMTELYKVSSLGDIYSITSKRILSLCKVTGYFAVKMKSKEGQTKTYKVHRIVAETFLGKPPNNSYVVNHENGNKLDNRVSNLSWVTPSENAKHAIRNGLRNAPKPSQKVEVPENGKDVPVYLNYMATRDGKVYSKKRKIFLSPKRTGPGYLAVYLSKDGNRKYFEVHVIIATTFIPNPENKPIVNHKNSIRTDNRVENLEWVTRSENSIHAVRSGVYDNQKLSCRPVIQLDKEGKFINQFNSIKEASEKTGVHNTSIASACGGHYATAGGFKWKYFNPEELNL